MIILYPCTSRARFPFLSPAVRGSGVKKEADREDRSTANYSSTSRREAARFKWIMNKIICLASLIRWEKRNFDHTPFLTRLPFFRLNFFGEEMADVSSWAIIDRATNIFIGNIIKIMCIVCERFGNWKRWNYNYDEFYFLICYANGKDYRPPKIRE